MTVEGVPTAKVAVYFADICGLELPIFRAVAGILAGTLKVEVNKRHIYDFKMCIELIADFFI
jgi:glycerol-3-phosphate dehydrogenase